MKCWLLSIQEKYYTTLSPESNSGRVEDQIIHATAPTSSKARQEQAPVVQKVDNAIHRINHYPLDIAIGFAITYPVDSDLSSG